MILLQMVLFAGDGIIIIHPCRGCMVNVVDVIP
jgi:hypothetical protein